MLLICAIDSWVAVIPLRVAAPIDGKPDIRVSKIQLVSFWHAELTLSGTKRLSRKVGVNGLACLFILSPLINLADENVANKSSSPSLLSRFPYFWNKFRKLDSFWENYLC